MTVAWRNTSYLEVTRNVEKKETDDDEEICKRLNQASLAMQKKRM